MLVKSRDFFVPILVKSRVFGGHLAKIFFLRLISRFFSRFLFLEIYFSS
jgi:hypothetical protein